MECPHCGNSYVFKGTVVRKNGKLKVGYANDKEAHDYLVKEISRLEEETYHYEKKQAEEILFEAIRFDWDALYRNINERERELYLSIM